MILQGKAAQLCFSHMWMLNLNQHIVVGHGKYFDGFDVSCMEKHIISAFIMN